MAETPEKPSVLPELLAIEPVTTEHEINGWKYSVTVGTLPLDDNAGKPEAAIFYTAYTKAGYEPGERPLMFSFNGGPGSSSVWLHLGALGPKRVKLEPKGDMPSPPFVLVDNPDTWLEHCDLVFIDPVGTGYSRAEDEEKSKKFWSLNGDVESVAEFIRLYLTRAKRWASPLFIVGESYGTTRAAALSSYLVNRGIALNGIILVSSILNFQTARFHKGNDLPYIVFLPTYAATAWYHSALTGFSSLEQVLKESEEFALGEYTLALAQGDRLTSEARSSVIAKLRRLTGLSAEFIDNSDIRIEIQRFCKELLRNQKRTVGRLDSRFKGIDELAVNESPQHDPSMSSIVPPYTATINDYLTRTLGWTTDLPYHVFNPGELWKHWSYGDASQGHPDTSESLREAISKNPHMRILIASGYYDLATPYFATEFTVAHLGLDATLRNNIETRYYEAGHMMYVHEGCLSQLAQDVAGFILPTTS